MLAEVEARLGPEAHRIVVLGGSEAKLEVKHRRGRLFTQAIWGIVAKLDGELFYATVDATTRWAAGEGWRLAIRIVKEDATIEDGGGEFIVKMGKSVVDTIPAEPETVTLEDFLRRIVTYWV